MKIFFEERRKELLGWLKSYLQGQSKELAAINSFGKDLPSLLYEFTARGKTIRGCLVALFEGLYSGIITPGSTAAGAAMELFQTALLIHDDIMDRDELRRGRPSVYSAYQTMAREQGMLEPEHSGVSFAICAGDASFFLGMEALESMEISPRDYGAVCALCAKEMKGVSVAQMQDIANGVTDSSIDTEDITRLYRYKTGRYTFSLPMMTGGILGGASAEDLTLLSEMGEILGIIFQLKDDELGLFGEPENTGKPSGSDIIEGKKTLYYSKLCESLAGTKDEELISLFGKEELSRNELERVRNAVVETGIRDEIHSYIDVLSRAVDEKKKAIPRKNSGLSTVLEGFIRYNQTRTV